MSRQPDDAIVELAYPALAHGVAAAAPSESVSPIVDASTAFSTRFVASVKVSEEESMAVRICKRVTRTLVIEIAGLSAVRQA